jgi:hypothetical protein
MSGHQKNFASLAVGLKGYKQGHASLTAYASGT